MEGEHGASSDDVLQLRAQLTDEKTRHNEVVAVNASLSSQLTASKSELAEVSALPYVHSRPSSLTPRP